MFDWASRKAKGIPLPLPAEGKQEYVVESRVRIMAHTEVEAAHKVGALYYFQQRTEDIDFLGYRIMGVVNGDGITHTSPRDYPTHPGSFILSPYARYLRPLTMREAYGASFREVLRKCIATKREWVASLTARDIDPSYPADFRFLPEGWQRVQFTPEMLPTFRKAYQEAEGIAAKTFRYHGVEYVTAYAKYLLAYLDGFGAVETLNIPDPSAYFLPLHRSRLTVRKVGDSFGIFQNGKRHITTLYRSRSKACDRVEVERLWNLLGWHDGSVRVHP